MDYLKLQKLKKKLYFNVEDIMQIFGVTRGSARVICSRYARAGAFIRLKNNFYVLEQNWEDAPLRDFLAIANFLQTPSYISFIPALSWHEATTQVQRDFVESVSLKRSARFRAKGRIFNFYKFKKEYYFDFIKKNGIFVATKEKAFVDAAYLYSLGKYAADFSAIDFSKLDKKKVAGIRRKFPAKTKGIVEDLCRN